MTVRLPILALVAVLAANPAAAQQQVTGGAGGVVRGLDKVSGTTTDIDLAPGGEAAFGRLDITLGECRYPTDDPSSDAYAHLTIRDGNDGPVLFDGWMIASSPALSALDHPRFDVWLLRCKTS